MRDDAAFGAAMKARRTDAGVTLREVAAEMELSVGYISDLEHGRKAWRGGLIIAYTDAVERLNSSTRDVVTLHTAMMEGGPCLRCGKPMGLWRSMEACPQTVTVLADETR